MIELYGPESIYSKPGSANSGMYNPADAHFLNLVGAVERREASTLRSEARLIGDASDKTHDGADAKRAGTALDAWKRQARAEWRGAGCGNDDVAKVQADLESLSDALLAFQPLRKESMAVYLSPFLA